MKKMMIFGALSLSLCLLSGCGGASGPDGLMQEQIDSMNELADAIESGADKSKIEAIQKQMKETEKKLDALKLSDAEKKKLVEKYKDKIAEATGRMMGAALKKGMKDMKLP